MRLAVVAGEASGDLHASDVIRELKKRDPDLAMFGIGGDLLAREGMTLMHHASEMGVVGFVDVLRHYPMFKRAFRELMERIEKERPDAVFLVDYPGFNLRVARRCKELGIRVIYYISPQLWAWRQGRVRHIARFVDRMIVIFPFEEAFYRKHGVPVRYVGHPLIEQLAAVRRPPRRADELRIALLPGSRRMEVRGLLPAMLDAVKILDRSPGDGRRVHAYIIQAPTIEHALLEEILDESDSDIPILPHDRGEGIAAADVALCASGTVTLEAAILGTPVVVMYRLSRLTYLLGKKLVQLPNFSLVNIVGEKEIVPELVQREVNGERIAAEVRKMVAPDNFGKICAELARIREKLGGPGASARAAEEIVSMVQKDG